jgi:hypothetical protein
MYTKTFLERYFRKSVSSNVNPERGRNVRHITWAGRGWHLAASREGVLLWLILQEPHAEPVYREGIRKEGGRVHFACYGSPSQLEKASAVLAWGRRLVTFCC